MNLSATRPLMLFLMGVIFVKRTSLTLVKTVTRGETVSLLCPNILKEPSYTAWFKHTNNSLPLCIATKYTSEKADVTYLNGFKKNHMEMTVNDTFSSLKIISVDVSDSGLFYCGSFLNNYMMFHNKTQLVVLNVNQHKEDVEKADYEVTEETLMSCHVYCTLTLIFSSLVLLSTVFVIVVLIKWKKTHNMEDAQVLFHQEEIINLLQKDQDLNFAPVSFAKKTRRAMRSLKDVESHVVYAVIRQTKD